MKPRRHTEESGKSKVCFVFFSGWVAMHLLFDNDGFMHLY